MSERDDRYAGNDPVGATGIPRTTGEFRAAPDVSASTAEFRAFAAGQTQGAGQAADTGAWPEQPWAGEAVGGSSRLVPMVVGIAVALVIIIAIAFFLF
jgi:hypothetical protein